MSQSNGAALSCPTIETIQADWTRYDRLARWLAWSKLHWRDNVGSVEDAVAEAIGHSWVEFQRIRTKQPAKPIKTAIRLAVRFGVGRVVHRVRLVPKKSPNHIDAMERRSLTSHRFDDFAGGRELAIAKCNTADRYLVEVIIGQLPDDLQALARLLSYGVDKTAARRRRGLSRRRADRLYAGLRQSLRAILAKGGET